MRRPPRAVLVTLTTVVLWLFATHVGTAAVLRQPNGSLNGGVLASAVSAGSRHTCALTSEGGVRCWGANGSGQLGDSSRKDRTQPVDVKGLVGDAVAVSAGAYHTCALDASGRVACWGLNLYGQLGDGTLSDHAVAVPVRGLPAKVVAISAGGGQTCALTQAGEVRCWGKNGYGQLGDGTGRQRTRPVKVRGLSGKAVALSVGSRHACAVLTTGAVECWGANYWGQLGDGTVLQRSRAVPVRGLAGRAIAISAGRYYTCAALHNGRVECWGSNFYGQLGSRGPGYSVKPIPVTLLSSPAVAVAAGGRHTCALTSKGTVQCWGTNGSGQLGVGAATDVSKPIDTLSGHPVAVSSGEYHACALMAEGSVDCWGSNFFGQLGSGTQFASSTPVSTRGLSRPALAVSSGESHTCALLEGASVECWGWNEFGQLGDGTTTDRSDTTETAELDGEPIAVAAGGRHTCALVTRSMHADSVQCWGVNNRGQVGDGTTAATPRPVAVQGLADVPTAVDAGEEHTCALLASHTVSCWGANGDGQLGDGSTRDALKAVLVSALFGVTAVVAGGYHTCALIDTGSIECLGANDSGQLGDGTTRPRATPTTVSGLSGVPMAMAAGYGHTCALSSEAAVECWGANDQGQVGNGTTSPQRSWPPLQSYRSATTYARSRSALATAARSCAREPSLAGAQTSGANSETARPSHGQRRYRSTASLAPRSRSPRAETTRARSFSPAACSAGVGTTSANSATASLLPQDRRYLPASSASVRRPSSQPGLRPPPRRQLECRSTVSFRGVCSLSFKLNWQPPFPNKAIGSPRALDGAIAAAGRAAAEIKSGFGPGHQEPVNENPGAGDPAALTSIERSPVAAPPRWTSSFVPADALPSFAYS